MVSVAFGAQRLIIRSRFFLDAALCQVFSIWSILYLSASFCALEPEPPPQAPLPAIKTPTPMSAAVTSSFFMPHPPTGRCSLNGDGRPDLRPSALDGLTISAVCLRPARAALSARLDRDHPRLALDHGDDVLGEELLRLDRLPVLDAARVRRDRDLRQPLADLDRLADALDHVVRRPDPDDVAGDHLVVRRRRELLHDP